jgi:hypothetical protein
LPPVDTSIMTSTLSTNYLSMTTNSRRTPQKNYNS